MVFYFSGTGNSRLAAKQIAESLGDEPISINHFLKNGGKKTFHSEKALVFVAPTYAWRLPKVVERWIQETVFTGNKAAYFVLTCGGNVGNAAAYAKALCRKKGMNFRGLAPIIMPENYIAMFPTPGEEECQSILKQAKPKISALAERIKRNELFTAATITMKDRLQSGPVNLWFYPFAVEDKGFTVSDVCISCGKCARRCALNNIGMKDGKPVWNGKCTHCMACIGGCPVEAIEYKAASKGQRRYFIAEE